MKNSNNKILIIAVVLLLITNIALVALMVTGKGKDNGKGRRGKTEPFELMVKELGLTEEQQTNFKQLKEAHFNTTKPLYDSLRAARTAFFTLLKEENVSDSMLTSYSQRVNEKQMAIDKILFAHFKKVRSLCTPEQQPKFDAFVQKMMQRGRKDSADGKRK
jgi:Spy/CpxP family protein refolding chaperone